MIIRTVGGCDTPSINLKMAKLATTSAAMTKSSNRFAWDIFAPNENKMSDGGRRRALLGVKVRKSSQKWSVRRSAVRSIAWLGLCGFIGGRGATIGAQLHNKFFAIIAIAHILSCKLESAFL